MSVRVETAIQFDESPAIAGWLGAVPLARAEGNTGVEALGGKLCGSLSNRPTWLSSAEGRFKLTSPPNWALGSFPPTWTPRSWPDHDAVPSELGTPCSAPQRSPEPSGRTGWYGLPSARWVRQ